MQLGYRYARPEVLEAERDTFKDAILAGRLRKAIERLNPHLTADNVGRAVRTITHATGTGLGDINQRSTSLSPTASRSSRTSVTAFRARRFG